MSGGRPKRSAALKAQEALAKNIKDIAKPELLATTEGVYNSPRNSTKVVRGGDSSSSEYVSGSSEEEVEEIGEEMKTGGQGNVKPKHHLKPPLKSKKPQRMETGSSLRSDESKVLTVAHKHKVRGRPRKDEATSPATSGLIGPSINSLQFWIKCLEHAHPIQRSLRIGRGKNSSFLQPPLDLLSVLDPRDVETFPLVQPLVPALKALNEPLPDEEDREDGAILVHLSASQTFCVKLSQSQYDPEQGVLTLNSGFGPVSALDFGPDGSDLFTLSNFPERSFKDHWALPSEGGHDCPIKIYRLEKGFTKASLVMTLHHPFGLVRRLHFCPVMPSSRDNVLLLAIFGDGKARVFSIPFPITGCSAKRVGDGGYQLLSTVGTEDGIIISAGAWGPTSNALGHSSTSIRIALGSTDGKLFLWDLGPSGARCIAAERHGNLPVTSLSFHHSDPMIVAVGLNDSPAYMVDWRSPSATCPLHSPLANVPLVKWAPLYNSWLVGDTENNVRAVRLQNSMDRNSFPAGSFPLPVTTFDVSTIHNVVASACSDGTLHLSWLDSKSKSVALEQCILHLRSSEQSVHLDVVVTHPPILPKQAAHELPKMGTCMPIVRWSCSREYPGLLALTSPLNGLVLLVAIDRFLLLQPSQEQE